MSYQITLKRIVVVAALLALCCLFTEAKLLGRSRYYEDPYSGGYDGYGRYGGYDRGVRTGERAIMTVRGARNPYDGRAPAKIAIEDDPYRGPYPRGVLDRREPYGMSRYPSSGYGFPGYGLMSGAPDRIAVTGVYPLGYGAGSRYRGFP